MKKEKGSLPISKPDLDRILAESSQSSGFRHNSAFDPNKYFLGEMPYGEYGYYFQTQDKVGISSSLSEEPARETVKHEEAHRQTYHLKIIRDLDLNFRPIHDEAWALLLKAFGGKLPAAYYYSSDSRELDVGSREGFYNLQRHGMFWYDDIFFLNKQELDPKENKRRFSLGNGKFKKAIKEIEEHYMKAPAYRSLITVERDGGMRLINSGKVYEINAIPDFDNNTLRIFYRQLETGSK